MLVLTMKLGEYVIVNETRIKILPKGINSVKLLIKGPDPVVRGTLTGEPFEEFESDSENT